MTTKLAVGLASLVLALAVVVSPPAGPPVRAETTVSFQRGHLTVAGLPNRQVRVQGYAFDTEYFTSTTNVRFTINGNFYVPRYRLANKFWDLTGTNAYAGDNHGFDEYLPAPPGTSTVCLEANTRGVFVQVECRAVTVPGAPAARGRFMGGSWDHQPGQTHNLRYRFANAPAGWGLHPYAGVQSWSVDDKIDISLAPTAVDDMTFHFGDYTLIMGDDWARAYVHDCAADGLWTPQPEFSFNGCTISPVTNAQINTVAIGNNTNRIQKVLAHETGHMLGLFHPQNGCCSVMHQGDVGGNTAQAPAGFDLGSIDLLYT